MLTQTQYIARPDRLSGAVAGKASAQAFNKSQRQTSIISSMIAQFICDRLNLDAIDDGTINTLETNFIAAVRSTFSIAPTGVVPGTYGPTMTLAVQLDGRITGLVNAGLPPTGVVAGTYVGTTVTVGTDGRITGISGVAYGPLAGTNPWTGVNTFSAPGSLNPILINGTTTNGAGIGFQGNGTVTPNKWIRVQAGSLQIVNSAYTGVPFIFGDNGNLTMTGSLNVAVNATITGVTFFGSSGNFFINPNNGGNQLLSFAPSQYLQFQPGFGFVLSTTGTIDLVAPITAISGTTNTAGPINSTGNITANSGRLRASLGALGSGDAASGVILNDFASSQGGLGWMQEPNGLIHQWGSFGAVAGAGPQLFGLARSWPNGVPLNITISYLCHNNPPTGSIGADFGGAANGQAAYQNTASSGTHGVYWHAIGF